MNYDSILENIVFDLLENLFNDLRNNNTEIRNKENNLVKLSQQMQKTISVLNDQQRNSIEEYISEVNNLTCNYYNAIYVQGFKDCIKLLGFIEII
ncbi:hypothetical protein [Wukongibacter sp. M2B1]|uniref:hypothetical protein n=1 Tax=Wukongibacter sp. M2B1 TaxID=3088895 RepID=UPI003D7B1D0F